MLRNDDAYDCIVNFLFYYTIILLKQISIYLIFLCGLIILNFDVFGLGIPSSHRTRDLSAWALWEIDSPISNTMLKLKSWDWLFMFRVVYQIFILHNICASPCHCRNFPAIFFDSKGFAAILGGMSDSCEEVPLTATFRPPVPCQNRIWDWCR